MLSIKRLFPPWKKSKEIFFLTARVDTSLIDAGKRFYHAMITEKASLLQQCWVASFQKLPFLVKLFLTQSMSNIALLTCQRLPDLFETDQTLIPLFKQRGINAEAAVWDDPTIDWKKYDALVIRNTWDYYTKSDAFINWLKYIRDNNITMLNSAEVVLQNIHKFYLRDFEKEGVRIIPTVFSDRREAVTLHTLKQKQWDTVVIKPAISAGSYQTKTYHVNELLPQGLDELLSGNDWLIQPFLPEIEQGELSMIFINGKFSHAAIKKPKDGDFRVQRQYGGKYELIDPGAPLLAVAEKVIAQVPQQLLYARVDGVMINNEFHLMELELIEPDLYFELDASIKPRFISAVEERLKKK
jgi:glutathione synthase/RimK-type ligase-like ATP-grasp enzyme